MLVEDAIAQQIAAMLRGTSDERGSGIEVSSYGLFGSARITWGERSEKIVIEVLAAGFQNSYNKPSVKIKLVARSASSSPDLGRGSLREGRTSVPTGIQTVLGCFHLLKLATSFRRSMTLLVVYRII